MLALRAPRASSRSCADVAGPGAAARCEWPIVFVAATVRPAASPTSAMTMSALPRFPFTGPPTLAPVIDRPISVVLLSCLDCNRGSRRIRLDAADEHARVVPAEAHCVRKRHVDLRRARLARD